MSDGRDLTVTEGVLQWVDDAWAYIDSETLESENFEDTKTAVYIARCVSRCKDIDQRADLRPGADGSPQGMLTDAMLRDGYDDDVIARVEANERLRQAFDDVCARCQFHTGNQYIVCDCDDVTLELRDAIHDTGDQ